MKTKEKKNPVGRPRIAIKEKKSRMVYISDAVYNFYVAAGGGNFSKGVMVIFNERNNAKQGAMTASVEDK